jgi:hypothetical protein
VVADDGTRLAEQRRDPLDVLPDRWFCAGTLIVTGQVPDAASSTVPTWRVASSPPRRRGERECGDVGAAAMNGAS